MKDRFGLKQLILVTVFTLFFTLIDLAIDHFTGIRWTSPRDFMELLTLVALALLWVWYFVDKFRFYNKCWGQAMSLTPLS